MNDYFFKNYSSNIVKILAYATIVLLILLTLVSRTPEAGFVFNSLWAEDGNIFASHASLYGLDSIWLSYAGYLHFYPRAVALLADFIGIDSIPIIYLSGWLLAFSLLVFVTIKKMSIYGVKSWVSVMAVLLIILQPTNGEVFFTLTNAQWFIGAALILHVLIPTKQTSVYLYPVFMFVASLTGPFSLLIMPLLIMRLLILKDFKFHIPTYLIVSGGALIQLLFMLGSERVDVVSSGHGLKHVYDTIISYLSFGASTTIVVMLSLVYWLLLLISFAQYFRIKSKTESSIKFVPIFVFIGSIWLLFVAMLAVGDAQYILSPLGWGGRYFFIPYTLLIIGTLLVADYPSLRLIMLSCLLIISLESFSKIERTNLQYRAYVSLSEIHPGLVIPINPVWAAYPSWHLKNQSISSSKSVRFIDINYLNVHVDGGDYRISEGDLIIEAVDIDPKIVFNASGLCTDSKYVGVIVNMTRSNAGWTEMFWGDASGFSEDRTIKRFYPSGIVEAQYAFKNITDELMVRFDPMIEKGNVIVHKFRLYCLE